MSSILSLLNNANIHLHTIYTINGQEMEIDAIEEDTIFYTLRAGNFKSTNRVYWGCFRAAWFASLQAAA